MSKRGVKKVKYLRSIDEYQSNENKLGQPSRTPPQMEQEQKPPGVTFNNAMPNQGSLSQKVSPPSSVHYQSSGGNPPNSSSNLKQMMNTGSSEGKNAQEHLIEYFKTGQTTAGYAGGVVQKKQRRKAGSGQKQKLPQTTNQTIDAPTIISNILSTPIHGSNSQFSNYGQVSQNAQVMQQPKTAQTSSRKDTSGANVAQSQDTASDVQSGMTSIQGKFRQNQPTPIFETFKKTAVKQASHQQMQLEQYLVDANAESMLSPGQKRHHPHTEVISHQKHMKQSNASGFEQITQQTAMEGSWSPQQNQAQAQPNTAKAQLMQLLESGAGNGNQKRQHTQHAKQPSASSTGVSSLMANMFMDPGNMPIGANNLTAKQPVASQSRHHQSQQQAFLQHSMSPPRRHQQNFNHQAPASHGMLSVENANIKRDFILKTCLSNDVLSQGAAAAAQAQIAQGAGSRHQSQRKDTSHQKGAGQTQAINPIYHQLSASPISKRQRSAPKFRGNAGAPRDKHRQSSHVPQHQQQIHSSHPRTKKRHQNSSVSRASARAKSHQMQLQALHAGPAVGYMSNQQQAYEKRDIGRPPILQQHGQQSNQNLIGNPQQQTTQTRAARGRNKNNSQSQLTGANNGDMKNMTQPNLQLGTAVKHQGRNKATISSSVQNGNHQLNGREISPIKSLAAIAIGMRQNQCQTALMQHKTGSQPAIPSLSQIKTPTSKHLKEIKNANKTTSTRHSKRDLVERYEHPHTTQNTMTQSISKINACQHPQHGYNSKSSKNTAANHNVNNPSTKRNELANYLSKILNQQQKMHLNTYDQAQLQTLYENGTGSQHSVKLMGKQQQLQTTKISSGKSLGKHQNQLQIHSQQASGGAAGASGAIVMPSSTKASKKNGGVVLLSDHQQQVGRYQTAGRTDYQHQTRKSQPSSSSKRGKSNHQRDNSNQLQEGNQAHTASEQRQLKQMFVRFSSQKDSNPDIQQHNQYIPSSKAQKGTAGRAVIKSHTTQNQQNASTQSNANSLLLIKHQQQLMNQSRKNAGGGSKKHYQLQSTEQVARKGSAVVHGDQNNFLLAQNIQNAIQSRKDVLDMLDLAKVDFHPAQKPQYGKSNSERTLKNAQKEDLMVTEHTIVNIRAHDISEDQQQMDEGDDNAQENYAVISDDPGENRAQSRSNRVEYHSDRDRASSRFSQQHNYHSNGEFVPMATNQQQFNQQKIVTTTAFEEQQQNERRATVGTIEVNSLRTQTSQDIRSEINPSSRTYENLRALQEVVAVSKCDIGVQTSGLGIPPESSPAAHKESTAEVSHREDKNSESRIIYDEAEKEANLAELAIWAKEKAAIDGYSIFFAEQLEPFMRSLLQQVSQQPQSLSSAAQKLDIFGIRHDQAFSKDDRKNSVTADMIHKMISTMVVSFQKLIKVNGDQIKRVEQVAEAEMLDKDAQQDIFKDQIRKLQKELFIRSEKMHLQEQMNKLKEKEVTTLRNKINALTEAAERSQKEHLLTLQKKDQQQEMNFTKVNRELKTLYEQNKDLFEHNKALRDDLQDTDEKVRKLVNVIQRHSSVMRDIENELDRTETKAHDQSQISQAIPTSQRKNENDSQLNPQPNWIKEFSPQNADNQAPHGVVFVGQNKIAIPKFDPDVIEKYNKLNIEGKLPHIVETNKFDPEAVKQQVKEMFKEIKRDVYPEQSYSEQYKTPLVIRQQTNDSGIGNATPVSPDPKSQQTELERRKNQMMFHDTSNDDMSGGGERKQRNIMTKLPSVNSPHYLLENQAMGAGIIQVNNQMMQSQPIQRLPETISSPFLPSGSSLLPVMSHPKMGTQTPSQKHHHHKSNQDLHHHMANGPKKDYEHMGFSSYIEKKQHQAQTIVTLQNQLYHQLLNQNQNQNSNQQQQQAYIKPYDNTPNNHQQSSAVNSPNHRQNSHSCQANLMSPPSQQVQSSNLMSPSTSPIQPNQHHYRSSLLSSQKESQSTLPQQNQLMQQVQQQQKNQSAPHYCESGPQFQSIDQPLLQTPSQTATLALELTEGLQHQIMQNNSSDVGASTAVFNQILIRDTQEAGIAFQSINELSPAHQHQMIPGSLLHHGGSTTYQQELQNHQHHLLNNHQTREQQHKPQQTTQSQQLAAASSLLQRAMQYEEEKCVHLQIQNGLSPSTISHYQENTTPAGNNDTSNQTKSANQPGGGTLQDQISKQYSPILRRQESMEHMNDFSPSLINDRNELSNAADGYHKNQLGTKLNGNTPMMKVVDCSPDHGAFGLTSIDQEKSVSLLDSIAIKEEDSTQKKYIEPYQSQSMGGSVDHGGNEQSNSAGQIMIEPCEINFPQLHHPQPYQHQNMMDYQPIHAYGDPLIQQQQQNLQQQQQQQIQQQMQQQYEEQKFSGGEAPLDISQVNDNFDSRYNDSQSQQDSADFLEDQNFGQDADSGGRRSSDDGFIDGQNLSQDYQQRF